MCANGVHVFPLYKIFEESLSATDSFPTSIYILMSEEEFKQSAHDFRVNMSSQFNGVIENLDGTAI